MVIVVGVAIGAMLMAQPKDVDGWGKVKWGMTIAQAKVAYGSEAQAPDRENGSTKYVERLTLRNLKVGDIRMRVAIETLPGSDRIAEVALSLEDGQRISPYLTLKNSLTQKYGRPSHEERSQRENVVSLSAAWIFPSTVISLLWLETKDVDFRELVLQYTATDKKALDAL
jgi:hypothetical protein